jgi:hypothetical protein
MLVLVNGPGSEIGYWSGFEVSFVKLKTID